MIAAASLGEAPVGEKPTLIGIGGFAWSGDPAVTYSTLLGSCIAVCLHDPAMAKGGIIHFLLGEAPSPESDDLRYGDVALRVLTRSLGQLGCRMDRMQATVAGGGDLVANMKKIGTENADFALHWLRSREIEIIRKDLGGSCARRVRFVPSTGACSINLIDAPIPPIRG